MLDQGLCWKCREFLIANGFNIDKIIPEVFCKHEPKENPLCWCKRHPNFGVSYSDLYGDFIWLSQVDIHFCPQCGRKL